MRVAKQPKDNDLDLSVKNQLIIPIDHDYPGGSAAMHNAVFRHYDLPYRTTFVVANPECAETIVDTFRADSQYVGGGVGSGFKDKVIPYLDELDDSARIVGSVNVIAKQDGKLKGYNTDGIGFVKGLLAEYPDSIEHKKVVVLGAGGTALPIAYELAKQNPREVVVLNRTVSKAKNLVSKIAEYVPARCGGEQDIRQELRTADLVINTTNKGAQPNEQYSAFGPMSDDYERDRKIAEDNLSVIPASAIVADILLEDDTLTLQMARAQGNRTHNGRQMNLYQAVPALKLMTGLDVDDASLEKIMRGGL